MRMLILLYDYALRVESPIQPNQHFQPCRCFGLRDVRVGLPLVSICDMACEDRSCAYVTRVKVVNDAVSL
jgi:hypothetical protein